MTTDSAFPATSTVHSNYSSATTYRTVPLAIRVVNKYILHLAYQPILHLSTPLELWPLMATRLAYLSSAASARTVAGRFFGGIDHANGSNGARSSVTLVIPKSAPATTMTFEHGSSAVNFGAASASNPQPPSSSRVIDF